MRRVLERSGESAVAGGVGRCIAGLSVVGVGGAAVDTLSAAGRSVRWASQRV